MPKYENSVIYKIKHNEDYDDNNIYVGSTANFKNRKNQHKSDCNNEKRKNYNFPVYQYIRDNGNWDNWVMIPIEEYPCNSKNELVIRERHHIDLLRPTLNIVKPGRTDKEYYEDNKEKNKKYREDNKEQIAEYEKIYRDANKEKLAEKHKKYYEANKEKLYEKAKEYRKNNKEIIAEYKKKHYKANKEKLAEKNKKYREDNKEQITEYKKECQKIKEICDHCGCEVCKTGLKKHQKTTKCINFVKTE